METETTEETPTKTNRDKVKYVAELVVGVSVANITKLFIKQTVMPKNKFQQVELAVAAFTIGGMMAKGAKTHTNDTVDSAFNFVETALYGKTSAPDTTETPE